MLVCIGCFLVGVGVGVAGWGWWWNRQFTSLLDEIGYPRDRRDG